MTFCGSYKTHFTKQWSNVRKKRINILNQILGGIKAVKFLALEDYFGKLMNELFQVELKYQRLCLYVTHTTNFFGMALSPLSLIMIVSFITIYDRSTDVPTVITVLTYTKIFLEILEALPGFTTSYYSAVVAVKSIDQYLVKPELNKSEYFMSSPKTENEAIRISNGFFTWSSSSTSEFCLKDINFHVEKGSLMAVIGRVGCGKSALLAAISGILHKHSGNVQVSNNAYEGFGMVNQDSWLQNDTIRNNILLDSHFEMNKYNTILSACDLLNDFKAFPNGDETHVGNGGICLSGGQKARISLARVVYQDYSVYLLDDIFSAVDKDVSKHILDEVVLGLLKSKTRIVCTHNISYLKYFDKVIYMNEGTIGKIEGSESVIEQKKLTMFKTVNNIKDNKSLNGTLMKSMLSNVSNNTLSSEKYSLVQLLMNYASKCGIRMCAFIAIMQILMQGSYNASDVCLSMWASRSYNSVILRFYTDKDALLFTMFLCLSFSYIIFLLFRTLFYIRSTSNPPQKLHKICMNKILSLKLRKLATTHLGAFVAVLNDNLTHVQINLPESLMAFLNPWITLVGMLVVLGYNMPQITPLLFFLIYGIYNLCKQHSVGGRQLTVLQFDVISHIYAFFAETSSGLVFIQSSNKFHFFDSKFRSLVDDFVVVALNRFILQCWMTIRVYLLSTLALSLTIAYSIYNKEVLHQGLHPELYILSISYLLSIKTLLKQVTAQTSKVESGLVNFQRVEELANIHHSELENLNDHIKVPDHWPSEGSISFVDVSMKYGSDLPFALHNVSFKIQGGEKVVIIGRTGAGKSSLYSALYKLSDSIEGKIIIDDVCVDNLSLRGYRSRIAMLPQDAFIFSGSVRSNLDHLGKHSDAELKCVLHKVKLTSAIESYLIKLGGLDAMLDGDRNPFSFGERQLFCLARAILQQSRILCLDEATANVDPDTSKVIHDIIFTELNCCTVLIIAHRIEAVRNYDRIMVIDEGRLLENGSPGNLLKYSKSPFFEKSI